MPAVVSSAAAVSSSVPVDGGAVPRGLPDPVAPDEPQDRTAAPTSGAPLVQIEPPVSPAAARDAVPARTAEISPTPARDLDVRAVPSDRAAAAAPTSRVYAKAPDAPHPQPSSTEQTLESEAMPELEAAILHLLPSGPAGLQRTPDPASIGVAAPAAPDPGRAVAAQLVAAVRADRDGAFEVRLSPEELGAVRLSLQVVDGSVTLAIHAERPETMDLMRRSIDILEREFRDAGFTSMSFSFGHGSGDGRSAKAAGYLTTAPERLADPLAAEDNGAAATSERTVSRLDLRL